MPVLVQIIMGSAILVVCSLLHIWLLSVVINRIRISRLLPKTSSRNRQFLTIASAVFVLLASHTAHVYIWAIALLGVGALAGYEQPIYFSLVTYTTVGYGDVTLPADFRIFGAMAAVSGTIAFGLSTAFLVGYFAQMTGMGSKET